MNNILNGKTSCSPLTSIYGENPLLSPLGSRISYQDLSKKLSNRPLCDYSLAGLDTDAREELLVLYLQNFVPTANSIEIFAALQTLHREHYWRRHPRNPTVLRDRARIAQISRMADADIKSLPWLSNPASGMIIKGITGTGKSSVINRYTDLLTAKVHEHTDNAIPGFEYVKQIVWLKIDMSSDGSRDGFLTSILLEVDNLLDTNYAKQYSGRYSIDKLAVMVAVILSTHLCGMLIIEEIQEKNFNNSKWRNPLTTFFLRVLNFGIPTVLIGNPLGFTELEKSSQNIRRLSSGGIFEALPYLKNDDEDFQYLVQQTSTFSVMENTSAVGNEYFRQVAYAYSGGITDFVVRLNVESQRVALHCGDKEVLPEHIDAAFEGPHFKSNHSLIAGLANRDPDRLYECDDVPVERFINIWIAIGGKDDEAIDSSKESKNSSKQLASKGLDECEVKDLNYENKSELVESNNSIKRQQPKRVASEHTLVKQFKSQQTKDKNRKKKADMQKSKLDPKDIRSEGTSKSLVDNLKDLLQKTK